MKTMNDYTCRCTEEQTRRALKLGAPVHFIGYIFFDDFKGKVVECDCKFYAIPTTQQIIKWLRDEKHIWVEPRHGDCGVHMWVGKFEPTTNGTWTEVYSEYELAEIAAIDVALERLEKGDVQC